MKRSLKKLLLVGLLTGLGTSLAANELTHNNDYDWYLVPSYSYLHSDQSRFGTDEDGTSFGLDLGKKINENIDLQFGYQRHIIDLIGGGDARRNGYTLDGLFYINRNDKFAPYLKAGIGTSSSSLTDDNNALYKVGFGFTSDLGVLNQAKLRLEATIQQDIISSEWKHDDALIGLGILIPFAKQAAATPAPVTTPVEAPKDSDGDGVYDADDLCPATPAGTAVDARGCALPKDSDGDGVYDDADECPNTPAGVRVDARGCALPADSDGDGVIDADDQCPNTAAGVRVDFKGCEIKAVITLPGINFELNSATLTADSLDVLNGAAGTLNTYTDINAEVAGHTDSTGSASYNQGLSERRAAAVKDYLVSRGVAASRLTSRGYGEDQPIADNSTKEGRAQNRRVELRVQD